MSLLVLNWGGGFYSSNTAGSKTEEWSCSLSLIAPSSPNLVTLTPSVSVAVQAWFNEPYVAMRASTRLEYMKLNEYDAVTGLQLTDPTNEVSYLAANIRGPQAQDFDGPITMACRISLDDGTRDRKAKGGFYSPRPAISVEHSGRIDTAEVVTQADYNQDFIDALNAITGLTVGVWSRVRGSVVAVTRLRVGDVPDNVRRRRNELMENYEVRSIS